MPRDPDKHYCHAPGCSVVVPPKLFMCKRHWYKLPKRLRDAIWANYVPGQERRKDPTDSYLEVARECQAYIASQERSLF
jgi:hypothetical protein